jgi:ABC-2 type transport system ATP-binding protein
MAVVEIRDLSKSYGKVEALKGVTFDIGAGVTGLLGPNGAGKSTLLLCVLGLLEGWHGQVSVLGLDARAEGREVRRRVGFMPEADCYLPEMSGIQAVRHLGRLGGLPRAEALRRAHEVLWHVGLGEAVYREIREYSVGMRQRFKLAQALVHDPEVLFLDEPGSNLDPDGQKWLESWVAAFVEREKTVVLATNDVGEMQWGSRRVELAG